jgi:hypothetical protein
VKNLKFGVLLFGLIGIVSMFLPMISMGEASFSMWDARQGAALNVYGGLAGFAIALVAGIAGAAKPPFTKMHAIGATVGFGLALVLLSDMKPWKIFEIFKGALGAKLMGVAILGGLIVSIVSLVKSEEA